MKGKMDAALQRLKLRILTIFGDLTADELDSGELLERFALRRKLVSFGFALMVLLSGVLGAASLWRAVQISSSARSGSRTQTFLASMETILGHTTDAEIAVRRYLLGGDQRDLAQYEAARQAIEREFSVLGNLAARRFDQRVRSNTDLLVQLCQARLAGFEEAIDSLKRNGGGPAHGEGGMPAATLAVDDFRMAARAIQAEEALLIGWQWHLAVGRAKQAMIMIVLPSLLAFGLVCLARLILNHDTKRRKDAYLLCKNVQSCLQGVLDMMRDPLLILDGDLRVKRANEAFLRMVRFSRQEVENKLLYEIGEAMWDIPNLRLMTEQLGSKIREFQDVEFQHDFPRIGPKTILISGRRFHLRGHGARMVLLLIRDITPRKETETALRESRERLDEAVLKLQDAQREIEQQKSLQPSSKMARGLLHDLNNALTPIVGFGELLARNPQGPDDKTKLRRWLQTMQVAAQELAHRAGRLRQLLHPNDSSESWRPLDINELLKEAIFLAEPEWKDQAFARNLAIRIETQFQQMPSILANGPALRTALTDLLVRAAETMQEDGVITVRTKTDDRQHIVVEIAQSDSQNGEQADQCPAESAVSEETEAELWPQWPMIGSMMRRLGGSIEIKRAPGKCTASVVRLPMCIAQQQRPAQGAETPQRPLRVLVVEDEPLIRDMAAEYLNNCGHTVEVAGNGYDALKKFSSGQFDLILTDKAMPGLSGEQIAAAIKEVAPRLPIIMVTGYTDLAEELGQEPEAVDLVLGKPFTFSELNEAIAKATACAGV